MTTNHHTQTDLRLDLQERWVPTADQRKRAEAMLRAGVDDGDGHVFTGHLLLDKSYGCWTADVQVVALDGVFTDRLSCNQWVHEAGRIMHEKSGRKLTGGYSMHFLRDGKEEAAMWEDIMTRFGED